MSDDDIKRAVAPFWRCPDCGSKGTPYVAALDALRARVADLEADRDSWRRVAERLEREKLFLRKALEDAPPFGQGGYFQWYVTTRREALDG